MLIPSLIVPDKAAVLAFIFTTIQTDIHIVSINSETMQTQGRWFGGDAKAAADWAFSANVRGFNAYWTVNVCRPGVNSKPKKSDIIGTRFLHVDIDPPKDGSVFDKAAATQSLIEAPIPPTAAIDSGGGLQAFWRHDGRVVPDEVEALNRALSAQFAGDAVANVDRLMRLPGTVNWPDAKKRARGRVPVMASTIQPDTGEVHSIEELARVYPPIAVPTPAIRGAVEIDWGAVEPISADSLGLAASDGLRFLIYSPKGLDRSRDTLRFAVEALKRGLSAEQVAGVLTDGGNAVAAHTLEQDNPQRAVQRTIDRAWAETEVVRSFSCADVDNDDDEAAPIAQHWTIETMISQCVFISEGSRVARIDRPRSALPWPDFKNQTAASTMPIVIKGRGESDRVAQAQVSEQWLKNPRRLDAETLTFNPAGGVFTQTPDDKTALNTWTGFPAHIPPSDWAERSAPFVEHLKWLFGADASAFLDWLAHVAQRPGVLPTFGFLHIAPAQGLGRGWVAEVLASVFGGRHVERGFDLVGTLKSGFNGQLGGKLIAVVDEIDAGGAQWSITQSLKKIVTEPTRVVNAKYGRMTVEHNVCRWLIFSNSETALPLEGGDRRFHVTRCDDPPRDKDYYAQLYVLRNDAQFIASVAEFLRQRDISAFRHGAPPPITAAKHALITRMRSDNEALLRDVAVRWPVDLIAYDEITHLLGHNAASNGRSLAHDLDRAGLRKVCRIKLRGSATSVYAVRNHELWADVSPSAARAEINRKSSEAKEAALDCGDTAPVDGDFFN